jgi:NTE family protein
VNIHKKGKTFGVALGGGGARGLAHALALKTIDECGIRPGMIAGTSMGAIMGALYASGISGSELVERIEAHIITENDTIKQKLSKAQKSSQWLKVLNFDFKGRGIFKADRFLKSLSEKLGVETFEELKIPLKVIATNFWTGEQVVFSSGKLLPAIHASMAIPGIFTPVVIDGQVLVDGGLCNNLPYDVLKPDCDYIIAIDVSPGSQNDRKKPPDATDAVIGMFDILIRRIEMLSLAKDPPDIYLSTDIKNVRVLDFHKVAEIFRQGRGPAERLRRELNQIHP